MGLDENDRSIAGFTMFGHALVHWFEMSIPILLVVWLDVFPVDTALVGLVVALGYAPFGLGALPGGLLADRYGTKPVILVCFAGMTLSFLLLSLAPNIYFVAGALVVWGIAASVYHPAGMALISTGASKRGTVFAYHGMAGNAGIALGPFTAATLLVFFEWRIVAAVLAVPGLAAIAYGLWSEFDPIAAVSEDVDAGAGSEISPSALLDNSRGLFAGGFLVVFALVTFEGLYYRGVLTFFPEILQGLPVMEGITLSAGLRGFEPADYLFVGLLVVGMAGQYAGGKLTDRIRIERGMVVIFGLLALLALAFVPATEAGLLALVALCAVLGVLLFAIQPFYQVAVASYTPADTRGLSYGYTYLAEFGFGAASIAIGGVLLEAYTLSLFFAVLAVFAGVGGLLALLLLAGSDRFRFLERKSAEAAD